MLALLFLLGICLPSRWSPPFSLHALAQISLLLVKVRLSPTLTLSPLIIWYSGQMVFFLFLLARAAPAFLPTAFSVALRPLFLSQQAQYVQVFPLKPAPFCMLFACLGSIITPATSLLLLSDSRSVLSSYLKLCGRSRRNRLLSPPILSGYNGSPDIRFSRGTTRLMSWPDGDRYLRPLQSLVVSLLLFVISTVLFSRTESVLSHLNSLTHRFPRFPSRNLCTLVTLAVFSLVYVATDTVCC